MNKLAKLTALTMTAGMLLAACGDADDTDDTLPGTEEPADNGVDDGLDDNGTDDGMDDDMDDDGLLDDEDDDDDGDGILDDDEMDDDE